MTHQILSPGSVNPEMVKVSNQLWTKSICMPSRCIQKTGIEMEMLVYDSETLVPLGLPGARISSQDLVRDIHKLAKNSKLRVDAPTGVVIGVELENGGNFSIEPGGQVEYSSSPLINSEALAQEVSEGLQLMEAAAAGRVAFASHGTNPVAPVDMPLLLPKSRYAMLSRYFESEPNGRGVHMSRHTCTVQANLDINGEDGWHDAVNLTWMLTPFSRHLFSNSKYFQQKKSDYLSERQAIWAHMDPSRTGIPPGVPFAKDIPEAYADWARKAQVFIVTSLPDSEQPMFGELTFEQWLQNGYKGVYPTLGDWETHLGTLFPDLRLRGFLEVRSIDAQPFEHTLAPVVFWMALLQNSQARKRCWEFLLGIARCYANCMYGQDVMNGKSDEHIYRFLLAADPDHPVFTDVRLHRQLLNIAIESLAAKKDQIGINALTGYKNFLGEKEAYWTAEDAASFLRKIVTLSPSKAFVCHLNSSLVQQVL